MQVQHHCISLMVHLFFFLMLLRPPRSTLFPYTTLFRPRPSLRLALSHEMRRMLYSRGRSATPRREVSNVGANASQSLQEILGIDSQQPVSAVTHVFSR